MLLALLSVALIVVALVGRRGLRIAALVAAAIALAFSLHALSKPPTNGANIFSPSVTGSTYVSSNPTAGPGVTVAIAGLGAAIVGLALSLAVE